MIEILSASAGSGKTFTLARNYIYLLLRNRRDREHFRHILAVTFTNKATDEMKSRILQELHRLSTHPEASPLAPYFLPGEKSLYGAPVCPDEDTLKKASGDILSAILHDYGSFSVSTIDKFFQRALKSFSRDAGHFTGYQIELDREALIEKAVAQLLDGLTEADKPLLAYLRRGAMDALENGRKMNLLRQLSGAASRLFGEEFRQAQQEAPVLSPSLAPNQVDALIRWCRAFEQDFVEGVRRLADSYLCMMEAAGLSPEDFSGGSRSFACTLRNKYRPLKRGDKPEALTPTLEKAMAAPEAWFSKSDKAAEAKRARLPEEKMVETATAFLRLFEQDYVRYLTVRAVSAGIWSLGVAAELRRSYDSLTREKNLLTLEDSNTLLRGIIDGSDAPFVYERLGVRYEHFLLDEFQDTARVQWDNMLPLLLESQSHEDRGGGEPYGLIVGDIKQSIYRWRGSDWTLMREKAPEALRRAGIRVLNDTLQENYRSLRAIVDFNNAFFRVLADGFDAALGAVEDRPLGRIYDEQSFPQRLPEAKRDGPGGHVDIEFLPSEEVSARALDIIREWRDNGVRLGDMAILVRVNSHGAAIAEYLMGRDPSIRIVSDDSLRIRSSEVVRRLVAALYALLGKDTALQAFITGKEAPAAHPAPGRSLMDVCQQLLRSEDPSLLSAHTLFVDAFLDMLQDYVATSGNDLSGFLSYYEEQDRSIASPEGSDAVRIITVHKSKGLQFPYVIYLNIHGSNELTFRQDDRKWCLLSTDDPVLAPIAGRLYDLNMQASHEKDLFRPVWEKEKCLKHIDVINTYYVAFTRPKYGLCILSDGKPKAANVAGALYRFADDPLSGFTKLDGGEEGARFRFGEPYYAASSSTQAAPGRFPMAFVSYAPGERLRFSPDAGDFFGGDGMVGVDASVRRLGTAYHRILASVERPSDLAEAVESERLRGGLDASQAARALERLREAVAFGAANGLFPEGARVLNEQPLMDRDGTVLRPDRVIIDGGRVTVVDYKFGAEDARYFRQIGRYARAFREMGYGEVDAFLWYVNEDKLLPLQNN